jgi:oligoribonuclease NrnB/cAMP/cGMP phosphodiesterase (DHH superfamily)
MEKLISIKKEFLSSENDNWVLITHASCNDGIGSALVALAYAKNTNTKEPEIFYCQYGMEPPMEDLIGKHVIIADFSFEEEELEAINKVAETLVVLDHHDTPIKKGLDKLPYVYIDQSKSGCRLLYHYIHDVYGTVIKEDRDVPYLLRLIEDRDLWNWKYPDTRAAYAFIKSKSLDWLYENVVELTSHQSKLLEDSLLKYNGVIEYQDNHITKVVKKIPDMEFVEFDGTLVPCINSTTLISETGNALAEETDYSVQYFITDTEIVFSLRSIGKEYDVAAIAMKFGGGGHPNSAGFGVKLEDFNFYDFFVNKRLELSTFNKAKDFLKLSAGYKTITGLINKIDEIVTDNGSPTIVQQRVAKLKEAEKNGDLEDMLMEEGEITKIYINRVLSEPASNKNIISLRGSDCLVKFVCPKCKTSDQIKYNFGNGAPWYVECDNCGNGEYDLGDIIEVANWVDDIEKIN